MLYATTTKTARMQAVRDLLAGGTLEIGDSGFITTIAVFTLASPAGVVSGDTLTLSFTTTTEAVLANGAAAEARLKNSGGTVEISELVVGTVAADIIIDKTSLFVGMDVIVTSASIQHAP